MSSRLGKAKAALIAAAGLYGGWKLRDVMEGAKPASLLARASQHLESWWDHCFSSASGEGGAEDRRMRQLRLRREHREESKKLHAAIEELQRRVVDGPSYQHEFPPLPSPTPPPPPQQRRA